MYPTGELQEMQNLPTSPRNSISEQPPRAPISTAKTRPRTHGCTDVFCLVIFIIFCIVEVAIAVVALAYGNPWLLLYPRDSQGDLCGYDYPTKQNLLFFDIVQCARMGPTVFVAGCQTPQVCVSSCPTEYSTYWTSEAIELLNGMQN